MPLDLPLLSGNRSDCRQSGFGRNRSEVPVELENGGEGVGAPKGLLYHISRICAADRHQHPLSLHNITDAYGIGKTGYVRLVLKETLAGADGDAGRCHPVSALGKAVTGFIEAGMTVGPRPSNCKSIPPRLRITSS